MSVTFRMVETSLQRMMKRPGGLKAGQAIEAAERNLDEIGDACLAALDEQLATITGLTAPQAERRLEPDELALVIAAAERALTICGAVRIPFIGEALRMLCVLSETLMEADPWPDGALTPALNLLTLVRGGQVDADAGALIVAELERSLERYRRRATEG